jgi:RNA polymerase sigma factor (sigma-70 family)
VNLPTSKDPSDSEYAQWIADEIQPHETALRSYLKNQFPTIEADDVVQETYLKLLKYKTGKKIASTRAYAFSIARNTALTLFRRRKIYSPVPVSELPGWRIIDGGPDAAETANRQHKLDLAIEAVEQLPSRCREIVQLAAFQNLSAAEIALKMGISESTVYVQMGRGLKRCAEYLRERGGQ